MKALVIVLLLLIPGVALADKCWPEPNEYRWPSDIDGWWIKAPAEARFHATEMGDCFRNLITHEVYRIIYIEEDDEECFKALGWENVWTGDYALLTPEDLGHNWIERTPCPQGRML